VNRNRFQHPWLGNGPGSVQSWWTRNLIIIGGSKILWQQDIEYSYGGLYIYILVTIINKINIIIMNILILYNIPEYGRLCINKHIHIINMLISHNKPIKYALTEFHRTLKPISSRITIQWDKTSILCLLQSRSCPFPLLARFQKRCVVKGKLLMPMKRYPVSSYYVSIPCLAGKSSRNAADFCPTIFVANRP
jgi:hypothetical protein